ncbi:MAG: AAA family ATPase, partial [Victivallaceae bacterium]|nr:AAA family ATPase [Victivallaceae bacterium]
TIREFQKRNPLNTLYLAPTGIAAQNIGAVTIHSCFKFPLNVINMEMLVNAALEERTLFQNTEAVLIEEISMVRVEIIEAIEKVLRRCGDPQLAFGGKKIIVSGDYKQLPPVQADHWIKMQLDLKYGGEYAFMAPVWQKAKFKTIRLTRIQRQQDAKFQGILNIIREGDITNCAAALNEINQRCYYPGRQIGNDNTVFLCCRNLDVRNMNGIEVAANFFNAIYSQGIIKGQLPDDLPVPEDLYLYLGQKVMLAKNEYREDGTGFRNGNMGVIVELDERNDLYIRVRLFDGSYRTIFKAEWFNFAYRLGPYQNGRRKVEKEVIGVYTQFPIIPAGALSIHRSQGKSLDAVHIVPGLGGFFTAWQLYVAMSRCKFLETLTVDKLLTPDDLIIDKRVVDFYDSLNVDDSYIS